MFNELKFFSFLNKLLLKEPKNITTNIKEFSNMLVYSAKKNIAKLMDEYSTLYPATSSASASGKSKGTLLVSAKIIIKKYMVEGINK